jgi:hypothetical protein
MYVIIVAKSAGFVKFVLDLNVITLFLSLIFTTLENGLQQLIVSLSVWRYYVKANHVCVCGCAATRVLHEAWNCIWFHLHWDSADILCYIISIKYVILCVVRANHTLKT